MTFAHLQRPAVGLAASPGRSGDGSKFGGLPDLPSDFVWPRYGGRLLDFLLQIDLADLAGFETGLDLPPDGNLLFFYDANEQPWGFRPEDRGSGQVFFFDRDTRLLPTNRTDEGPPLPETGVVFEQIMTIPDSDSTWVEDLGPERKDYSDWREANEHLLNTGSQIGGHPFLVQNSMELECELASSGVNVGGPEGYASALVQKEVRKWKLLLQLDSDDSRGMLWGDAGNIYFWIKQEDLARRDFSNVWLVLQCY